MIVTFRWSWNIVLPAALILAACPSLRAGPHGADSATRQPAERPPAANRLLLTPDARPMRAGSGYAAVHNLFFPVIGIGITDVFSVSGGVSLVPGLDGQYAMVSPKLTPYATDGLALSCALLYAGRIGEDAAGIVYAGVTSDGGAGSGTFGLGWSWSGEGIDGRAVILAGFRVPVAAGFELVSENWFPPNFDPALISFGWRYSTGNVSVDVATWMPARGDGAGSASFVPWISFAFGF
jgi:hypothetical protein